MINNQPDIDKIYLYARDQYEAKFQYFINKHEKVGLNHHDDPKSFNERSCDMKDGFKNTEEYNPWKKRKALIVFYNMIADIVTELFI